MNSTVAFLKHLDREGERGSEFQSAHGSDIKALNVVTQFSHSWELRQFDWHKIEKSIFV